MVDADGLRVAELVPDAATSGWLPFVRVERLAEACLRIVALGGAAEEPVLGRAPRATRWCATRRAWRSPSTRAGELA